MKNFFPTVFLFFGLFMTCVISAEAKERHTDRTISRGESILAPSALAVDSGAQQPANGKKAKKGKSKKDSGKNEASGTSGAAKDGSADGKKGGKGQKDIQNQTQFMKPDMDATDYNFYDRKKISTPLMPRYDLDSAVYQKGFRKMEDQQKAFVQNKYRYPAMPKNQWELGLVFGSALIAGDITPDWTKGWGGGFTVRKALNYYFSLRFEYTYSQIKALDFNPRQDVAFDVALNGTGSNANYFLGSYGNEKIVFHNYENQVHNFHIDGMLNLGNVLFHKERSKVSVSLFAGVGMHMWRCLEDMLNSNGQIYDFTSVLNDYNTEKFVNHATTAQIDKVVGNDLSHLLSGQYTVSSVLATKGSWQFAHYYLTPDITAGLQIDFHVTKWVTLGLSERFIFNNNSGLDGVQWQDDSHPGFAPHYDHYFQTMLHLNFNIGKNAVEPLWWLNPLDFTYKRLNDVNPDEIAKKMFKDTDEDGVPDYLDKEPNTKKGCPVDVHGVILDSDKDGIPDCEDKEPFSPPGYPIDQNGVAIIPPNPCCDNDTSGGAENGPGANGVNGTGGSKGNKKGGHGGNGPQYDCSRMEMPGVFFDEDKYYIDPAYYSALHQVAEKLQMCPDVKMVVTGTDESKNDQKYNEQLAYNRATSVVDYLVEKYGISRDRFIVKYQGGKKADTNLSTQERKKTRRVDIGYAGDGEKGESNPPAPHPGLKAGSNK